MKNKALIILVVLLCMLCSCTKTEQNSPVSENGVWEKEFYDCGISINDRITEEFAFVGNEVYFCSIDHEKDDKPYLSFYKGNVFLNDFFVDTGITAPYMYGEPWNAQTIPGTEKSAIYLFKNDQEEKVVIEEYNEAGSSKEFMAIPRECISGEIVISFAISGDGIVLLQTENTLYGCTGKEEKDGSIPIIYDKPKDSTILKIFSVGNKFYCLARENKYSKEIPVKVYLYGSDGSIEKSIEIPNNSTAITPLVDEIAFFVEDQGIYRVDLDLNLCECVVNLSEEEKKCKNVAAIIRKEDKYGYLYQSVADLAYRTVVFNKITQQDTEVIELVLYDPLGTAESYCPGKLIESFNEMYPKYHVSVMETQKDLNFVLASDEQPDLLLLENSDMSILGIQGYLEDLNPLLNSDSSNLKDELFEGLLDKISYKNMIFGLPNDIRIYTLCAKSSLVDNKAGWTTEEFLDWMLDQPDVLKDSPITRDYLLQDILNGGMNSYIDYEKGKCYFDGENFRRHLKKLSEIEEYYKGGMVPVETGELRGIYLNLAYLAIRENPQDPWVYKGLPTFDGREMHSLDFKAMSILKTSKKKEAAFEFLKYYIRYRYIDNQYLSSNYPIFQKQAELVRKNYYFTDYSNEPVAVGQKEIDTLMRIYKNSEMYKFDTWEIERIVLEEAGTYLSGDKELEEVTDHIQNRVQLILDETTK